MHGQTKPAELSQGFPKNIFAVYGAPWE